MTKWVRLAQKRLSLSTHPKHRLVAVIVRSGCVLSHASNSHRWGHHAERRALLRASGDLDGATMIVVRDGLALAKPCLACQEAIKLAGISKVYYSNNGTLEEL